MENYSFFRIYKIQNIVTVILLLFGKNLVAQTTHQAELIRQFRLLRDTTPWQQLGAIPLDFPAYHPQGMVKVGPSFYMTSVEVIDRAAGRGKGHLFRFDQHGKLLADVLLGEGPMYHPGGIDYDGRYLWIPVAEYRPNSTSMLYRIEPETLAKEVVLRLDDHLGGVVHDREAQALYAISWGSRSFYTWHRDTTGGFPSRPTRTPNPSFYIDYQDCHSAGKQLMLCGGLKSYTKGSETFRLGGLDLVDLNTYRPVHQVPLTLWTASGRPMTQNPFWIEATDTGLRAYFVPEDDKATLYIYEATPDR